jgi:predicted NAD/FAD-binding protein
MRIAIIGGGISGNVCARLLSDDHDVRIFEAGSYLGGHTASVEVQAYGKEVTVDTGFMVFNERTYPNFTALLRHLGITAQESDMSFSVHCERTGLEYQGSSLNGLFAQRANLFRPAFYGMVRDILRFNREAPQLLNTDDDALTIGQYLTDNRYGREFTEHYLIPMGAAIWSSQPDHFFQFPARFLVAFLHNHGLLQLRDRPVWKTIPGGAKRYVEALMGPLMDRVRLNAKVTGVSRSADHVVVETAAGAPEIFDQVVFATHADQTLSMLTDASEQEQEVLRAFPYQKNDVVLHTDASLLPKRRRAWASWNYFIPQEEDQPATVTYDVNRLQNLGAPDPIGVTLNRTDAVDPSKILRSFVYDHPVFGPGAVAAQRRHGEISGVRRTHFCGAYWGYGFHEDGVNSALAVCRHFGKDLEQWKAASTEGLSSTSVAAM